MHARLDHVDERCFIGRIGAREGYRQLDAARPDGVEGRELARVGSREHFAKSQAKDEYGRPRREVDAPLRARKIRRSEKRIGQHRRGRERIPCTERIDRAAEPERNARSPCRLLARAR